ncbi:hypothetical protein [Crystallibacter degradans]|uniref:hypothetical protein n=1 Tax=Crystallibacter degradans TaxID=2726743 RepID=UPI0014762FC4|nr:hypothetical protein [Arthrobacter sp. SF27]NMR29943.1 hypothetical protein [Arthrobacter sp. SF27]
MTTNEDIIAALEGRPSKTEKAANEAIKKAVSGEPDAVEMAERNAIARVFGREPAPRVVEGALPLRKDGTESIALWAAKQTEETAIEGLRTAILKANPDTGFYVAEAEARAMADEAYEAAAKKYHYESERLESVARQADILTRVYTRGKK